MNTQYRTHSTAAAAIFLAAAVMAAGATLMGTTESSQATDSHAFEPDRYPPGVAVVVSKRQTGGLSFLGFVVRQPEYHVDVSFTVSESCWDPTRDGTTWPVAGASCDGPAAVAGPISGSGRTSTGDSIVVVAVSTSADCFEAVEPGVIWPSDVGMCSNTS